jgi:hypothetical protein
MAFESRYPAKVDRAIREGVAAKMRTKDILNALRAGTLPALSDEPIDIPDRTFHRKLKQARAKVAAGVKPKPEGPSLAARLLSWQAETPEELRSRLAAEGTDPETIDAAVEVLRQRKLAEQR